MVQFPKIIQGGMGVGVSNWRLAQTVSRLGQLGVVSGTALDSLFVRRLADGDLAGTCAGGWMPFPFPTWPSESGQEYFTAGRQSRAGTPYPAIPMHQRNSPRKVIELCMVSNFVEVFLAKEGHKNPVGINFLEKVQMPHLASIYGAMLAGVGYVLMGAGIPLHIPGVLDAFAAHHMAEYKLQVTGADWRLRTGYADASWIRPTMRKDRCRFCTGRSFWPLSPRTRWRRRCCGGRAGGWTDW